ncbi:MAG: hypothetical protein NT155_00460 [Candidatus Staskawiczbacteria bacterium]|nr:hypothetical protein [Candidatus Staskawiczbacteria bacterium]
MSRGTEVKTCQNCKHEFAIEPEDFDFYEKMKVPAPTFCPECRALRRHAWRNERVLYRRSCDLCGKSTVTIYSPNKPYKVYCPPCWWSDKWSALDFGADFDFKRPFFEQFQELQSKIPRIALLTKNSINSEYTNHSNNNKDCYLCFAVFDSENILYATNVWGKSRDSMELYRMTDAAELCYECSDSARIYQCQFGNLLRDCTDCLYCFDCRGCQHCFLSSNLRNKKYVFKNQQYTKEEYDKKIADYDLASHKVREKLYLEYKDLVVKKTVHRFAVTERSVNVSGNMITDSKNCKFVFDADKVEDTKYSVVCPDVKDCMDVYHFGFQSELVYESHALIHAYNVMFSHLSYDDSHIMYCDSCHNSENLFGCVGVIKGNYVIFNKQYSKEDYGVLKDKIIEHMKKTKEYGEFFPFSLSPFGYNETQGTIYMPRSKKEALALGMKWEELASGTFGKETISPENIPDSIIDVSENIIKEAFRCIECNRNYNIVKAEFDLYRRFIAPIPRRCPQCRYLNKIALRPPRKLWHRQCMCNKDHTHHTGQCTNEFETSYAPDRPEIVYCEQCYQQEVV